MRILYLTYFDVNSDKKTGVNKKIKNQVIALRELGHEVTLSGCRNNEMYFDNGNTIHTVQIKYGLTHYRWSVKKILKSDELKYDIVYIRFPGSIEPFFYFTLRDFSLSGSIVLLELPTYPIGQELKELLKNEWKKKKLLSLIIHCMAIANHRLFSRKMKTIVTKIVTYMPYDSIWNIKTIQIDNGVDVDACPAIFKDSAHKANNKMRLITVANVSTWHGIDRVITGIKEYYERNKNVDHDVQLTIVGDSPLCEELKQLAIQSHVDDKVIFAGAKFGDDLLYEYLNADVAIGSLGMHRINVINGSTLKVKEYCSLGIPFVYAYNEQQLSDSFLYAKKIPADDTPVNIDEIINFYEQLDFDSIKSVEMHEYAEKHYTWKRQMKKVLDSLES